MRRTQKRVGLNPELILDFLGGTAIVKSVHCWQRGTIAGISFSTELSFVVIGIYFSKIEEIPKDASDEFVTPGCSEPHVNYGMGFKVKPREATLIDDRILYVPTELRGEILEFKKPD